MVEPIRAIQCLMEAKEREMLNAISTIRATADATMEADADGEGMPQCNGFLNASLLQSMQPLSLRGAKIFGYRGEKVAGFDVDGKRMLCLPQAYQLFLKDLVGGLHTVYTKLRRLNITPLICNVEQVRSLRSLGAIQPGVNRCKLIADSGFDQLYNDCNALGSRPGRPPKRGWTLGSNWRPEDEARFDDTAHLGRRNRHGADGGRSCGGGASQRSAIPTLQAPETALSCVSSWLAQQQSTFTALQLLSGGLLIPSAQQQQQDPQILMRQLMAAATGTLPTQQIHHQKQPFGNTANQAIGCPNEAENLEMTIDSSGGNTGDTEAKSSKSGGTAASTLLYPQDVSLLVPTCGGEQREKRSKSLDSRLLPDGGKPQWNLGSEGSTNSGSTTGSSRSVDNEREKFLSQSASWGSSQCVEAAFDNEQQQQSIQCVLSKVSAMETTLIKLQEKIDALIASKPESAVETHLYYRKHAYRRGK